VAEPALDQITTWFGDWRLSSAPLAAHPARTEHGGAALALSEDYRERPVRFGPGDRLFGILAWPADETRLAPAIVLLNTAVEHHVGPNRLYVPLAREWAARGHFVLRFDLGGIGDSKAAYGAEENVAYPAQMLDDAHQAVAFVRRMAPHRSVIVAGLCSGGWLAFRAAREGLAVDAIVSVNPPLYLLDEAGRTWRTERDEIERYQQSMRDPSKWAKALRGGVSYSSFTRVAASAFRRQVAVRLGGVLGEALSDGLANDLGVIAARGIKSLFVFSRGDGGLEYFHLHAQPALGRARVRDFVQHVVVEGAGHSFRPRAAQRTLRELMVDFVASETCGND
jgi:alpha/beta superfamily hydrolase